MGGGDLCEDRFQEVRDDISAWIKNGGPATLQLPSGVSVTDYSQGMLAGIARAKVSCVGLGDPGFPVEVSGTPKACAFLNAPSELRITCDYVKFQAMSRSDQYILVHHEYAGIAGLEAPLGDVSTYAISNQISGYLNAVLVQKLAVKPQTSPSGSDLSVAQRVKVFESLLDYLDSHRNPELQKAAETVFAAHITDFNCKPLDGTHRSCLIQDVDQNYDRCFTRYYGLTVTLDQNLAVQNARLIDSTDFGGDDNPCARH